MSDKLIKSAQVDDITVYYTYCVFGRENNHTRTLTVCSDKTVQEIASSVYSFLLCHLSQIGISPRDVSFRLTKITQDTVGGHIVLY